MTTIKPISSAYVNSQYKSDRAEKIKKFINVAVPVIVATGITKKALSRSGIKLTDIFKNGNASKLWNSVINVLSAPVNKIQNKFASAVNKVVYCKLPATVADTGGSGIGATIGVILSGAICKLITNIANAVVDFLSAKVNDKLSPKPENNTISNETNVKELD